MRVLLVYPNANAEIIAYGDQGAIAEPLALEYIGAGAKLEGHEVRLLDLRLHIDDLESTLLDFVPDVVGVTGYSMHVLRNLEVCGVAKRLVPGCKTVAGGHHATLEAIDYCEPQMDYVVVGEGVQPFRKILALLDAGEAVAGVPGVWSRVDDEFVFGGDPLPYDINTIPTPDRMLAPHDRERYYIDWMKPIALMRTTVGCPYRCSFCSLWRIMDGRYYKREIDKVVAELQSIPEHYIFFVDDEPFVDPQRMKLLAEAIEEAGIDKEYFAYCRVDSLLRDIELMKQWKHIGLRRLLLGVETIFDWELKDYNKRQQRDDIVRALETARELDIALFCNFIISPRYGEKEFEEVVRFVKDHHVDYPSFTILTPIPGTGQGYDGVLEVQDNGRPDWNYFDLQHVVTESLLPKEEFMTRFYDLYHVFNYKYFESGSPLAVKNLTPPIEKFRQQRNVELARLALAERSHG